MANVTATRPAVKSARDAIRVGTVFTNHEGETFQVTESRHFQQGDPAERFNAHRIVDGRRAPRYTIFRMTGVAEIISEAAEGASNDPKFCQALDATAAGRAMWIPAAIEATLPAPLPLASLAPAVARVKAIASSRPRHEAVRGFDPIYHLTLAEAAVAEERAMWLTSKPMTVISSDGHSGPTVCTTDSGVLTTDFVLIDDDGTPLETAAEMDRRHRDEDAALKAVCQLRADWLADKPSEAPCCPADEPLPCQACISHPGPADEPITSLPADDDATEHDAEHLANEIERDDDADGDWDDSSTWELGPPDGMTLAELADHEALIFRSWQTAAGELFAAHMAALAASIRAVDAMTPGQYRDRFDAMLDSGF